MDVVAALVDALETGLAYMPAFLGIWIAFRIQHAFDLTVGGSFTIGAAVTAVSIGSGGNAWLALLGGSAAGAVAGLVTYLLHRFLDLRVILASIIVNTGLLSVNLTILGSPNVSIIRSENILDHAARWLGPSMSSQWVAIIVLSLIGGVVVTLVGLFLLTQIGLAFRMSGINPDMAKSMGVAPASMLLVALVMANALAGLSGSLVTQTQGFADLHMGDSLLIFGITGVLLGEIVVRKRAAAPIVGIAAVVAGSYLYRLLIALAFRVGVAPQLFNGLTALIVTLAVAVNVTMGRMQDRSRAEALVRSLDDEEAARTPAAVPAGGKR